MEIRLRRVQKPLHQVSNSRVYPSEGGFSLDAHSQHFLMSGTENERRSSADITGVDFFLRNDRFGRFGPSIDPAHADLGEDPFGADENHGDLQSLYSHRRYHAAEIGQLGTTRGAGKSKGSNSRTSNSRRLNSEPWPLETR